MAACNDDIYGECSKLYMGRPTGVVSKTYYCSKNCAYATHRAENTEDYKNYIVKWTGLLNQIKKSYLRAIRGELSDKETAAKGIMTFNYLSSGISLLKSLLARKSSEEELTLKWFKFKKYIGEMMEDACKDEKAVSKYCNELSHYGNPINIQAYAK
jgi:hypothetical protein